MAQTGKVYFLKDDATPRYDDVKEGWTCAAFVTKNGRTIMGWLPSSKLQDVAITHPKINNWSGSWTMNSKSMQANLKMTASHETLQIEGAYSDGPMDFSIRGSANPSENFSEFQYNSYKKELCMASMVRLWIYSK